MEAELEVVVSAVTGALAGGTVRPLLAPAEALSEVWKDVIKQRITQTAHRASRKHSGDKWEATERTTMRALTEAAFTDNPIVQEYLAGVIAGATEGNDNSHILSLISRLTPFQLMLHYKTYFGIVNFFQHEENWTDRWGVKFDNYDVDGTRQRFISTDVSALRDDPESHLRFNRAMEHLQRENLIEHFETKYSYGEDGIWFFTFGITGFGVEVFSAALGLDGASLKDICRDQPVVLEFDPPIRPFLVNDSSDERLLELVTNELKSAEQEPLF